MEFTAQVKGLKELSEALQLMPKKIQGKALGAAVASGAGIVRAAARARAPMDTGAVKKSIVSYRKRGSRPDNIGYQVGVTMQKKWPRKMYKTSFKGILRVRKIKSVTDVKQSAFWWKFQEFGTTKQAAKPFMRPAWDASSGRALAAIKLMLEKAVVIAASQVPKYSGQ